MRPMIPAVGNAQTFTGVIQTAIVIQFKGKMKGMRIRVAAAAVVEKMAVHVIHQTQNEGKVLIAPS